MKLLIVFSVFILSSYSFAKVQQYKLDCGNDTILGDFDATIEISNATNVTHLENLKNISGTCTNMSNKGFTIEFENNTQLKLIVEKRDEQVYLKSLTVKQMETEPTFEATSTINKPLSLATEFYECSKLETFALPSLSIPTLKADVIFRSFKLQAFNVNDGKYSQKYSVCTEGSSSTNNPSDTTQPTSPNVTTPTTSPNTTSSPSHHNTTSTTHFTPTITTPTITTPTTPTPDKGPVDLYIENNGTKCLNVGFLGNLTFSFMNGKKEKYFTHLINHGDVQGNFTGNCNQYESYVKALLSEGCSIEFRFSKNNTKDSTQLLDSNKYSLIVTIAYDTSKVGANPGKNVTLTEKIFSIDLKQSYKCSSLTLLSKNNTTLKATNFTAIAFGTTKGQVFTCAADNTGSNNIVPIVVGVILACLVVTIIIAYLIGRRRDRSGYQSV